MEGKGTSSCCFLQVSRELLWCQVKCEKKEYLKKSCCSNWKIEIREVGSELYAQKRLEKVRILVVKIENNLLLWERWWHSFWHGFLWFTHLMYRKRIGEHKVKMSVFIYSFQCLTLTISLKFCYDLNRLKTSFWKSIYDHKNRFYPL